MCSMHVAGHLRVPISLQDTIMFSISQTHLITETLSTDHLTGLRALRNALGREDVFVKLKGDVQGPE